VRLLSFPSWNSLPACIFFKFVGLDRFALSSTTTSPVNCNHLALAVRAGSEELARRISEGKKCNNEDSSTSPLNALTKHTPVIPSPAYPNDAVLITTTLLLMERGALFKAAQQDALIYAEQ
uniref:ANK_REP_REGION domain-containing protein n=1 Tax=Haemonchus contortus TaxID=6289 RepID=A0A7I4YP07_HAECO